MLAYVDPPTSGGTFSLLVIGSIVGGVVVFGGLGWFLYSVTGRKARRQNDPLR